MLAVGLVRAKVVPAWVAWLMPIGIVGIAGTLQYTILLTLSAIALIASFGYIGVKLLKSGNAEAPKAVPV